MTTTFIVKITSEDDDSPPIAGADEFRDWLDSVDEMGFSYEVTEQKTP